MRPLTEEETKTLFLKLSEYIGKNVEKMINRTDERHCFRLMKDRCYYISETQMKAANNIARENLLHVGTCIGKFTKSGKFRMHITALEYLSQYAKVRTKFWKNIFLYVMWLLRDYCFANVLCSLFFSTKCGWSNLRKCHFCMGIISQRMDWHEWLRIHHNMLESLYTICKT